MGTGAPDGSRSTARGRRLTAAERRASILEAAAEEFTLAGYQRARMADVAARVGVTEPVIFQNFGSKAALFATVLEQASDDLCGVLQGQIDAGVAVDAFVRELLGPGHLDVLHTSGGTGVLFADAVGLTSDPEIEQVARRSIRKVARVLALLFEQGQARGELRDDLDPATTAWWLLSFVAAHGFRHAVMPNRHQREPELAELVLQVIVGPATPSR